MNKIVFLLLLLLLAACKKAEDRNCWKFNGSPKERIVQLGSFHSIQVNVHLVVNLVQDTTNYLVIKGGENVIGKVKTDIVNGQLILKEENKCAFLRNPKKKIHVEVHFVTLEFIEYFGSELLKSVGAITVPSLEIEIRETSGTVDLEIYSDVITVSSEPSWGKFILSGQVLTANLVVKGNSSCDTRNLVALNKIIFNSRSGGDCYINGTTPHLKCETNSSGNVYYTGEPSWIEWNNYGTGKLLKAP